MQIVLYLRHGYSGYTVNSRVKYVLRRQIEEDSVFFLCVVNNYGLCFCCLVKQDLYSVSTQTKIV